MDAFRLTCQCGLFVVEKMGETAAAYTLQCGLDANGRIERDGTHTDRLQHRSIGSKQSKTPLGLAARLNADCRRFEQLQRHVEDYPGSPFLSSTSISLIGTTASPLQARISQQAPSGAQAQVGNTLPDSRSAQKLPNNVTDQVPDGKGLLFQVAGPDHFDRSGHQAGDRDYHGCDHHGFESEQFQQAFPRAAGRDRTSASMRWIAACPRTAKVTS